MKNIPSQNLENSRCTKCNQNLSITCIECNEKDIIRKFRYDIIKDILERTFHCEACKLLAIKMIEEK